MEDPRHNEPAHTPTRLREECLWDTQDSSVFAFSHVTPAANSNRYHNRLQWPGPTEWQAPIGGNTFIRECQLDVSPARFQQLGHMSKVPNHPVTGDVILYVVRKRNGNRVRFLYVLRCRGL